MDDNTAIVLIFLGLGCLSLVALWLLMRGPRRK